MRTSSLDASPHRASPTSAAPRASTRMPRNPHAAEPTRRGRACAPGSQKLRPASSGAPPPGGRKCVRAGKMAAVERPPRALVFLCRALFFLSQFYVLAGGGELRPGSRRAWPGGRGSAAGGERPGRPSAAAALGEPGVASSAAKPGDGGPRARGRGLGRGNGPHPTFRSLVALVAPRSSVFSAAKLCGFRSDYCVMWTPPVNRTPGLYVSG